MDIKGKVAWVTGGNSGMGAETVKMLVAKGAKVLVTARGVTSAGGNIVDEVGADNCMLIKADSTVYEELEAAVAQAVDKWGRLDILYSNAGGSYPGGVLLAEDKENQEALFADMKYGLDLNLWGYFYCARIAAIYMSKNEPDERGERGCIVVTASMAADKIWTWPTQKIGEIGTWPPDGPPPSWSCYGYSTAKAAVLGLSRDLSFSLGPVGIRVNTVKPGYIKTMLTEASQEFLEEQGNPMQIFPKYGGEPEDVAKLVIAIIENPFINRAAIPVDGGVIG